MVAHGDFRVPAGGDEIEIMITVEVVQHGPPSEIELIDAQRCSNVGELRKSNPGVPEIQGISKTAAGISLLLPEGTTYDIEYSTDLQNWSNVATDVTRSYDDTDAGRTGNPEGYYRGVAK